MGPAPGDLGDLELRTRATSNSVNARHVRLTQVPCPAERDIASSAAAL